MGSSCTRILLVALIILIVLMVAGMASAEPTNATAQDSGIQIACRACGLADVIGSRLQETAVKGEQINLDNPRLEFSAVAAVSPKLTGTGGAVSYQLGANANRTRAVWADLGAMRWEDSTDFFAGVSTNVPVGGQTLTERGRIGAGYLMRAGAPFIYTRVVINF